MMSGDWEMIFVSILISNRIMGGACAHAFQVFVLALCGAGVLSDRAFKVEVYS